MKLLQLITIKTIWLGSSHHNIMENNGKIVKNSKANHFHQWQAQSENRVADIQSRAQIASTASEVSITK